MKKLSYLLDLFKLIIAKLISPILKVNKSNRDIWIVGERKSEAKDNGYHLFKYIRENHPEKKAYYVIDKESSDLEKIESLGNVIYYDSFKHYLYYIMCTKLVCAHLGGCVPDSPICWKFHEHEMKNKKKIFIQHGITIGLIQSLMFENTKADLFVCGAEPEYEFVKNKFGYPDGNVQYLGFARFDNLHENTTKNQILVMPTWRKWIPSSTWESDNLEECREIFLKSEYFDRYNSLINNQELIDLLEQYNLELIFYPHYEMQVYVDLFKTQSDKVIIARKEEYDVQQLLKESKILITDYSSVAFDFAYMRKPVIYYQFDNDIYYKGHYQKGYFDYEEHGFGPVVKQLEKLLLRLGKILNSEVENPYKNRCEVFFEKHDKKNSERIYNAIDNLNFC